MKTILVPTDFSVLSNHAIDFAIKLAKPLKAQVQVVHFEDVPLGDLSLHLTGEAGNGAISSDSLYSAQLFRANKQKLAAIEGSYDTADINLRAFQCGGGFLTGIEKYTSENEVDLIVIGTTGEQSIQEFFSGNHTEQLIENVPVPVLSVQDQQLHRVEDIVLGLAIEDDEYTLNALRQVKTICDALGSTLHIVDITKSQNDNAMMQVLDQMAKKTGLTNYLVDVIEASNSKEALLEYAEGTDAGLIIVLSRAKGGLNRFVQHSFATRLTKDSSIPVLTINKKYFS